MNNEATQVSGTPTKTIAWADIVWYLSDISYLNATILAKLTETFSTVTIASKDPKPELMESSVKWHKYTEEDTRAQVWNESMRMGENSWVLFIVDDETPLVNTLDDEIAVNSSQWPASLILFSEGEKKYQYYQMRMVYVTDNFSFDGVNLPDCTRYIIQNQIEIANLPIEIMSRRNPNSHIEIEEELAVGNYSPQLFLENGYRLFKAKKYIHAAAQYRVVSNATNVLPFDRLSALNGISSCHAEMFRWEPALKTANDSIDEEPFQNMPYLIKFKIEQLNKNWIDAYDALFKYYENTYYERIKLHSKANYDVRISVESTLMNLIDLSFKAGLTQEASDHLEELFNLKEGNLDESYIKKLLVLSIELSDFEKSEFFFKKLFSGKFPKNLKDTEITELHDYMELFMKKSWYETVYQVYSELYQQFPQNDEIRRRLIVTLVKTKRVEQARNLASKVA